MNNDLHNTYQTDMVITSLETQNTKILRHQESLIQAVYKLAMVGFAGFTILGILTVWLAQRPSIINVDYTDRSTTECTTGFMSFGRCGDSNTDRRRMN